MSKHTGHYCPDCRGVRIHSVVTRKDDATGHTVRVRVCQTCFRGQPHGIACPKCAEPRFRVVFTRVGVGCVKRVKKCRGCSHRIRTIETVVSFSG